MGRIPKYTESSAPLRRKRREIGQSHFPELEPSGPPTRRLPLVRKKTRESAKRKEAGLVFDIQDLGLFGGLSEAYYFEESNIKNSWRGIFRTHQSQADCLDEEELGLIDSVYSHLQTIKGTNSKVYLAVKNFIKFPFQTAVYKHYSLDLVTDLSFEYFDRTFTAILNLHRRCEDCEHMQLFLEKIGFLTENSGRRTKTVEA